MSKAIEDIAAERQRQIEVEGWTSEHDDQHINEELAVAAAAYAGNTIGDPYPLVWPVGWDEGWWKPSDRRRELVKAGALIVAEIERLDRASKQGA